MSVDFDNPHACQLANIEKCGRDKLENCARCIECLTVQDFLRQCQALDLWEKIILKPEPDPETFIKNKLSITNFEIMITGFFQKIISRCSTTPADYDFNLPPMPIPKSQIPKDERLIIKVLKQMIDDIKQSKYEIDIEESIQWIENKFIENN